MLFDGLTHLQNMRNELGAWNYSCKKLKNSTDQSFFTTKRSAEFFQSLLCEGLKNWHNLLESFTLNRKDVPSLLAPQPFRIQKRLAIICNSKFVRLPSESNEVNFCVYRKV